MYKVHVLENYKECITAATYIFKNLSELYLFIDLCEPEQVLFIEQY